MDYRDENLRQNRSQNARERILTPSQKVQRDELLARRDALHNKQNASNGAKNKKNSVSKKVKKQGRFVIEKFHLWSAFLGLIILVLSLNLVTFVQGIQVKNNVNTPSQDLITWLTGDRFSFNGLYLWYKINHTEVEYPVSIVDAKISFQNPWTLTLSVTEKEILAGIIVNNSYVYFDNKGLVLLESSHIQEDVILLDGIEVKAVSLYESLVVKNTEVFQNLLEVIQLCKQYELEVNQFVPEESSEVSLVIGETMVKLGNDNYQEKISHITPILLRLEDKNGTLHLENFDGDTGTITFK